MGDLDFLHDIESMTSEECEDRRLELCAWARRFARGNANPKWVVPHMNELARLGEFVAAERDALRARVAELEAGDDDRRSASIHLRKSQAGRILDGRTWDEMPEDTHG